MKELETLLKFLLQMGWKPADFQGKSEIKISEDGGILIYFTFKFLKNAIQSMRYGKAYKGSYPEVL